MNEQMQPDPEEDPSSTFNIRERSWTDVSHDSDDPEYHEIVERIRARQSREDRDTDSIATQHDATRDARAIADFERRQVEQQLPLERPSWIRRVCMRLGRIATNRPSSDDTFTVQ